MLSLYNKKGVLNRRRGFPIKDIKHPIKDIKEKKQVSTSTIFLFAILGILVLALYFLIHYYLSVRFESIFQINHKIIFTVIFSLALLFLLMSILERYFTNLFTRILYTISAIWAGTFILLTIGFALTDLVFLLSQKANYTVSYKAIGLFMLAIILILIIYSLINAARIRIVRLNLPIKNLSKELKIIQLSDIHLGAIHSDLYLRKIVKKVDSLKPDFVFITGDLFDGSGKVSEQTIKPLLELKSTYGTYFIVGNHETYLDTENVINLIKSDNVTVLRNNIKIIGGIQIIGLDYPKNERIKKSDKLNTLLKQINKSKPAVFLTHAPTDYNEAANAGVTLQLSGHTHKGQIFPFTLMPYFQFKYISGLHKIKNMYLYVSQGTGTWGPPMRLGSFSEITEINVKKN